MHRQTCEEQEKQLIYFFPQLQNVIEGFLSRKHRGVLVLLVLLLQARAVTLRDKRAAERHRDTISDAGSRCLRRSARPPLQIRNAAPTLPLHVLPVHWSVPHFLPFALSLVLSLAHTHNHTKNRSLHSTLWDMILICIADIHPYMHVCMYYILTHIHTRIGTGGTHTPMAAT